MKCKNDSTKSYKGDEPSPKGLGYSASAEEVDCEMLGKDGNLWVVSQTKTCKRWVKQTNAKAKPKKIYVDKDGNPLKYEILASLIIDLKIEEINHLVDKAILRFVENKGYYKKIIADLHKVKILNHN
jgi:hypothetical protein